MIIVAARLPGEDAMLVAVSPMEPVSRLESSLVRWGVLSSAQLAQARDLAHRTYRYLGEVIVEMGAATVDDIRRAAEARS